jgi:DNA polymerase-3 subunit epsilon
MSAKGTAGDFAELLPEEAGWAERPTSEQIAALPNCAAVFLLFGAEQRPIQALSALQMRRGLTLRLGEPAERGKRADLGEIVRGVRWRRVESRFEARWVYLLLVRRLDPAGYRAQLGFGPAWYMVLDRTRLLPEIRVSERIWASPGEFAGPWRTQRAAQAALEQLWDLFDLCRHPEQLRRAPQGQRCAYFDMQRCDAPCDATAPPEPMAARTDAAWRFVCGRRDAWRAEAEHCMRAAATAQRFELAGQLKQQIERARQSEGMWRSVRHMEQMRDLLLIPAVRRRGWKPFWFDRGELRTGEVIPQRRLKPELEAWIVAQTQVAAAESDAVLRMEQTWLVAHLTERLDREPAVIVQVDPAPNATALAARAVERAGEVRPAETEAATEAEDRSTPAADERA